MVYFGEIGTVMEEEACEVIRAGGYTKPLVAYIAGKGLPAGLRFPMRAPSWRAAKGPLKERSRPSRKWAPPWWIDPMNWVLP